MFKCVFKTICKDYTQDYIKTISRLCLRDCKECIIGDLLKSILMVNYQEKRSRYSIIIKPGGYLGMG